MMRTLLKIVGVLLALLLVVAGAGLAYFLNRFPDVPPPQAARLPTAPEALARGEYLARHVMLCVDCHSQRDFSKFAGPIRAETFGGGGERFDHATAGVPGTIITPNITPVGLREWTDGELMRAVTEGVSRDGRALFPVMPYVNYGQLAEDDVKAALAYVRTLAPVESHPPARALDFPMNLIVRMIPRQASFGARPSPEDTVSYGRYLVTAAACGDCHTPLDDQGQPLPGMDFAGGFEFRHPELGYRIRSANITPDADTGIGRWTASQFVDKFKGLEGPDDRVLTDEEQRQNTAMPWRQYAGMTREDLSAIYAYLRTLKPVVHRVDTFPDAHASR
ncbi:MAG: c-type cytochrome [Acidobacteriota bacterium]|nr:c-type cytochrome [Acidobacteriota bacterium]